MKLIFILVFIASFTSCKLNQNNKGPVFVETQISDLIRDTIKNIIYSKCSSNFYIYDVTIVRLNTNAILYLHPITYIEYLDHKRFPITFYEYKQKLYLVYSGIESITKADDVYINLIQNKFDSVCTKYQISRQHSTNDTQPLFFKLNGNELIEYTNSNFYDFFFDRKLDTTKYEPLKIN